MQVFQIDKKKYFARELKKWLVLLFFSGIGAFGGYLMNTLDLNQIGYFLVGEILLLVQDLFQFHVREIIIDAGANELRFDLQSPLSGEMSKIFDLNDAKVILIENTGLRKWLFDPIQLKVFLPKKQVFKITKRYGFAAETLK